MVLHKKNIPNFLLQVTPDGCVTVNTDDAVDVLLKDNIVSINDVPGTEPIKVT